LVPVKSETLVCQRTQMTNTLRGHAAEFGVIADKDFAKLIQC
jgi:hypothetical protein